MKSTVWMLLWAWPMAEAQAAPRRFMDMTEAEVSARIHQAAQLKDMGSRLAAVTEPFLGTPYVLGNMGEGPDGDGRDKDPRYNVQSADCTTFVEHAMAFALSQDLDGARRTLDRIRYMKGDVGYGTRRHWPEAQWVAGLEAEGFLMDVTRAVAGTAVPVEEATVTLNAQLFAQSQHAASMPLKPEEVPQGTFTIPFIPLARAVALEKRLENGLVLNVVKAPKEGLLVRISHQGLVIKKGNQVFFRNATSVGPRAVTDEPWKEFVARQQKAKAWPTVGFELLRLKEGGP